MMNVREAAHKAGLNDAFRDLGCYEFDGRRSGWNVDLVCWITKNIYDVSTRLIQ